MPTTLATNWLYLASSRVPSTAANAVHVAHMCDALLDHGFSVTLAAPSASWRRSKNSLMDQYGLRHEVPLSPLWKPKIRRGREIGHLALKWRLLTSNPALIYGRLLWGCCIAAEMNKPTVFEIHKPEWESGRSAREDFMRLIASPGFRAIVCISAALETHVLKSFPSLEGKTIVAHDAAPSLDRPECHKESKSFVVGYFGSLYEGKGVETLLEVAPLCPWAVFQIVGGDAESIQYWQTTRQIPSNVFFLGHHPHPDLPSMMAKCHVLVAPYREKVMARGGTWEIGRWMSPLKLFEYMAMERPIVSADLPVLHEVLTHRENSILVPPTDATSWAATLQELRDDPHFARTIAQRARADYEQHYTWNARVSKLLSALRRLEII